MKIFFFILSLYSIQVSAQDSIYIDRDIAHEKGKYKTIKYTSVTTGTKTKAKLKTGKWDYFSETGILLKTENYDNGEKTSYLHGEVIFYDAERNAVLTRTYTNNKLISEQALRSCVLLFKNETLTLLELGDSVYIDYPVPVDMTWFNYDNILRINTIEDPNAPMKIAKYMAFEDSIGNPALLAKSSFTIYHPENAVANPSFEDHPETNTSVTSFSTQITSWVPASQTPDFYVTPAASRSGISFTGFRVYSKAKDIEYIENKLNYPLRKDQKYCFTAYLKLGPSCGVATDAFGVHFSPNAVSFNSLAKAKVTPQLVLNNEFLTYKSRWMLVQCSYTASGQERWMTLGSFKPMDQINLLPILGNAGESYYYIDDLSLVPIVTDAECPCNFGGNTDEDFVTRVTDKDSEQNIELEFSKMEVGDKLILKDVYFDNDAYTLLPKSESTLNDLIFLLTKFPTLTIEISGHTSSIGEYDHNVLLSANRANSVLQYLVTRGIESSRLTVAGFGPDQPVAPNDTEINQQKNRRVEVKITQK